VTLKRNTPLRAKDEKLCACGCGQPAGFYRKTAKRGQPRTYIHGHHARKQGPEYVVEDRSYQSACWVWVRCLDQDGYAQVTREGRSRRAARVFYEDHIGPIPDGLVIDHLCRVRPCVNPAHLEPVTNAENLRRGFAVITHCPKGHPYDEINTRKANGKRHCRACDYYRYHGNEAPWL
jgi:hypothetical protein